jgi:hypothetical protein
MSLSRSLLVSTALDVNCAWVARKETWRDRHIGIGIEHDARGDDEVAHMPLHCLVAFEDYKAAWR